MHTVLQGGIFLSLTKQWEVEELFTFPLELGCVKEGKKINVQVNWEAQELMGVIHIRGIYHITAKVRFGLERQEQFSAGTLIEHIDLEGDEGYFEYAIPFSLELPNGQLKDLRVEDIKTTCQDSLHIVWQVICVYDELTTTTDETQPENYLSIPKVDIKEQIAKVGEEIPLSKQFNNAGAGVLKNIDIPYQTPTDGFTNDAKAILDNEILESVEIAVKYRGYIQREQRIAEKILKLEDVRIPDNFDFLKVTSLSIESRQKLMKHRPTTIAQASRIPGVSPADVSVLLVYFGR